MNLLIAQALADQKIRDVINRSDGSHDVVQLNANQKRTFSRLRAAVGGTLIAAGLSIRGECIAFGRESMSARPAR
jgi:hypothetical protein